MLVVVVAADDDDDVGSWLLVSELFPAFIKGRAIAVTTSFNWATNLLVSATFLDFASTYKAQLMAL